MSAILPFVRLVVRRGPGGFEFTAREPTIYVVVSRLFLRPPIETAGNHFGRADLPVGQDAQQRVPTIII